MADYRFLETRGGARFAKASVVSTPSETWSCVLDASVCAVHAPAVRQGLALAIAEQDRRGGQKYAVVVTALLETAADTTSDAVECAVALAAWKSFGAGEEDVSVHFDAGTWRPVFRAR